MIWHYVYKNKACSVYKTTLRGTSFKPWPAIPIDCFSVINSLVPARCRCNLKLVIFILMARVDILGISCEIALRWLPQDFIDGKSTLVQVMVWCRQATSNYLSQCWPRSLSPYGVTRPQRVNTLRPEQNGWHFADNNIYIFMNEEVWIVIEFSLKVYSLASNWQ